MKRNRTLLTSVLKQCRILTVEHGIQAGARKEKRGVTLFIWNKEIETHRFYSYSKALEFLKLLKESGNK